MMKSLLITLLAAAGLALADTTSTTVDTSVTDSYTTSLGDVSVTVSTEKDKDDGYYYTTITAANSGSLLSVSGSKGQAEVSVSFVLNLTSLLTLYNSTEGVDANLQLLRLDFDTTQTGLTASDTGLYLTTDGTLAFRWQNSTYTYTSGKYTTVDSYTLFEWDDTNNCYVIASGVNTYTDSNGDVCIALTYVQHSSGGASTGTGDGATVTDTEGKIMYDAALASENNDQLTSIVLLSSYVTTATVYASELTSEEATSAAQAAAGIPEPTTATLSLLALAGLAARRRRK